MTKDNLKIIDHFAKDAASPDFSQKTVLVVEDDRSHRLIMDRILKSCGFQTVQAENGFVALSKIDSAPAPFDLIIMDLDMPGLDGLETVKAIRMREVQNGVKHTPVIAFTAHRKPADKEACLAAGMDAYLPKDVFMPKWRESLIESLSGLLSGKFELPTLGFLEDGHDSENEEIQNNTLDDFDLDVFYQSAALLKDELEIAIEEFLEDAADYIREIIQGFENKDLKRIARGSHPLKSNSKSFGLISVSQVAEKINQISEQSSDQTKGLNDIAPLLPDLKTAFKNGENTIKMEAKRLA